MSQKVTKTLLYAVLQRIHMEMTASKPARAVVLSSQDVSAGWRQVADLFSHKASIRQSWTL